MVIVEKSFPRGGTATKETHNEQAKENIIFGASQKKIKKSKPKAKDDLENLLESTEKETIESVSAELLNYDTIQDGMNIMGMVKSIDALYLSISLPGRMTARVSALEISDAYTKATKEFLQSAERMEHYKPLKELYHIGQLVYGQVLEVKQNEHGRTEINMSLKPTTVHAELQQLNVKKGFIFNGAIDEVQEHGYIIETGIKALRAFLPLEKSQSGYAVGELIYLKVEKVTHDKAASTCICKQLKPQNLKIKNQIEPNIDYMLPSTIVQFTVTKRLKDGLQGNIMNEAFTAYINEHQLGEALSLPEDYELNATLNARILYVMPLTKLVYLTLNLNASEVVAEQHQFKRGDVIEDAKVHHHGTGGVILVLKNKFKGVISYKTIKALYKGNYDQDELLSKYAKKTEHKVRVLDYDLMDSLYICTDDAKIVNEQVFDLADIRPGEFVTATVKERNAKVGGYVMQVGRVKGIIEQLHLAPNSKQLEPKSKIRCRVVSINSERHTVHLTNRSEYMSKNCKVLTSLTDAKEHAVYTGTIVKCYESYLLVKFFNHLKGVLYKQRLNGFIAGEVHNFYEGQTMQFRIIGKNAEQITLSLADDTFSLGEICPVTVTHALDTGLEIKITYEADTEEENASEIKGLIPIRLLSDFSDLLYAKLHIMPAGVKTQAACIVQNIFSLRDVPYFENHLTKDWRTVQEGDILKATVKNVTDDVVDLMLPISGYGKLVKVHLKMLLVNAYKNPNVVLAPEQVVYVKVLSKEQATKTIAVSAKLTDVWNGQLSSTAAYLESYLNEVATIRKALKKLNNPIAQYTVGEQVTGHFHAVHAETSDWQYELEGTKIPAFVRASAVGKAKPPKVGEKQECVVLWIDYANELLYVSSKSADIERITSSAQLPTNLAGKAGLNAKIVLVLDNLFICSLKKGKNPLVYCPRRLHFNDFENSASTDVKEGEFCRLAFVHESKSIAVLESTWKLWRDIAQKRKADEEAETQKRKKAKLAKEVKAEKELEEVHELSATVEKEGKKQQKRKITKNVEEEATAPAKQAKANKKIAKKKTVESTAETLFYEDRTPDIAELAKIETDTKHKKKQEAIASKIENSAKKETTVVEVKRLPGVSDFWNTDLAQLNSADNAVASSDEEEEDSNTDPSAKKKKKLSSAEKFKQQREEEARLRAIEEKYADPKQIPETVDQFDRLVLSEPNNSKNWINYMVFHLQSTEIDKARAVAKRAIKTISFRNSADQLNIWVALLNLELRYGSKESYDETLKEALTYNEPLQVYLRVADILSSSNKTQELIEVINTITRKYKAQQEVWKVAANAYFSIGMTDRAQQMLHKALASLPEREHVNTIVVFANLNHKHGNNEMAQTLLDQVVTSYPKRVDVWTQYIDLLVKEELIDSARSVLERAIIQKIPLKKMRTIFKKYLEFEERYGSDDDVQKVKQLAAEYVKKNANL